MARRGRCVAEAGVRDAASRAASKHAEAWVCPPASFPWPPLGADSLSSVPPPLPGFGSSARRLREARRAAGRRWWVGSVGRNAPAGLFATGRATRRHRRGCCRCRSRGRVRAFTGLPHIEAAHRGGDHDGDSSAPGRLVVFTGTMLQFRLREPDAAAPRSAPEIERFAGLSTADGRCESPMFTVPRVSNSQSRGVGEVP